MTNVSMLWRFTHNYVIFHVIFEPLTEQFLLLAGHHSYRIYRCRENAFEEHDIHHWCKIHRLFNSP